MSKSTSYQRTDGSPAVHPTAVRDQMNRVLTSPEFDVPDRTRQFLRYVVEETLEGRANRIKAFAIALEVFGRDQSFDGQKDPVVRIEAARIRRALERYYLVAGISDPILIEIPKGGYVPTFTQREVIQPPTPGSAHAPEPPSALPAPVPSPWSRRGAWAVLAVACVALTLALAVSLKWLLPAPTPPAPPRLVIASFKAQEGKPEETLYALGVVDQITTQLSRFKEIAVLGAETSRAAGSAPDLDHVRQDYRADFVLEGGVSAADNRIRVNAHLVDTSTRRILWSNAYDANLTARDLLALQSDIADQVAASIARPYGIVFQAQARGIPPTAPDDLDAYRCVLSYYLFRSRPTAEAHAAARSCLQRAVARFPDYAMAWAMLSYAYLDEYRWGFNPSSPGTEPIARSLEAARTAVRLEPDNVRALQALMMALFFSQDVAGAMAVAERALVLNPNDTEIMGEVGTRVGFAGDWNRAIALLECAFDANPAHSDYYRSNLAFAAYMKGDVDRAVREIRAANQEKLPMFHLLAAIFYAEGGLTKEANASKNRFLSLRPTFFDHLDTELDRRNFLPRDRARFINGLVKAGFPVPLHLVQTAPTR